MSERSSKLLVSDIIDSIEKINRYTAQLNFDEFCTTEIVVDAVIRNFGIVGEATSKLPRSFKSAHKNIDWKKIKNFRNLLIHEYFGIDLKITWAIIHDKLPGFLLVLKEIYKTLPDTLFDSQ